VEILPLNMNDSKTVEIGERLYKDLSDLGIEVLIDDREERAGVKFKDADLRDTHPNYHRRKESQRRTCRDKGQKD
jgi:prolyl-tRNA synthetase